MVILEDPLTADFPARNLLEEEEEAARSFAALYDVQPILQLTSKLPAEAVVLCLFGSPHFLLHVFQSVLPTLKEIGTVQVPSIHPSEKDNIARVFSSADLIIVSSASQLAPEQGHAWARRVLEHISRPKSVIIACTLPMMEYRGPGIATEQDLIFSINTTGYQDGHCLPPSMPSGTLVGGLPAALLQYCQVENIKGAIIAGIQAVQVPHSQFLANFGSIVCSVIGSDIPWFTIPSKNTMIEAMSSPIDHVYKSSASHSMFI